MSINTAELRGMIYEQYKTASAFSDAIGWNKQKTSKILNGGKVPDLDECEQMAAGLNMSQEQFCHIFLPNL